MFYKWILTHEVVINNFYHISSPSGAFHFFFYLIIHYVFLFQIFLFQFLSCWAHKYILFVCIFFGLFGSNHLEWNWTEWTLSVMDEWFGTIAAPFASGSSPLLRHTILLKMTHKNIASEFCETEIVGHVHVVAHNESRQYPYTEDYAYDMQLQMESDKNDDLEKIVPSDSTKRKHHKHRWVYNLIYSSSKVCLFFSNLNVDGP